MPTGSARSPVRAAVVSPSHPWGRVVSPGPGVGIATRMGSRVPDRPAAVADRAPPHLPGLTVSHHRAASTPLVGVPGAVGSAVEANAWPDPGEEVAGSPGDWPPGCGRAAALWSPDDVGAATVVAGVPTSPLGGADGAADAAGRATGRAGSAATAVPSGVELSVAAGDAGGGESVVVALVTMSGPPSAPLVRDGSANRIHVPTPSSSTAAVPPATMLRVWDTTDSIGGLRQIRMNRRCTGRAPATTGRTRPGPVYSASPSSDWIRVTPSTRSSSPSA